MRRREVACCFQYYRLRSIAREADGSTLLAGYGARRIGSRDPDAEGFRRLLFFLRVLLHLERRRQPEEAHPAEPVRGELGRSRGVNAVAAEPQRLAGLDGWLAGLAGLDELAAPCEPHADDDRRSPETTLQAAAAVGAARTRFAETEQVHVFVRAFGAGGYDRLLAGRAPVAAKAQSLSLIHI